MSKRMSCKDCEQFDKEHFDMYEEAICDEADAVIRLRRGQSRPSWCPKLKRDETIRKGEFT